MVYSFHRFTAYHRGDSVKRWIILLLIVGVLAVPVHGDTIRWVDFGVPYESLKYAMDVDIKTFDQEKHISWIDILALAGCRTGGKCGLASVKKAVKDLQGDKSLEELLKEHKNIKLLYTISTFQNPSGITMSVEKRKAVYEIAKENNIVIIEKVPHLWDFSFIKNIQFDIDICTG